MASQSHYIARMGSLAGLFTGSLCALALAACESSPPLVDDVQEDAPGRDAGSDASDGASSDDASD